VIGAPSLLLSEPFSLIALFVISRASLGAPSIRKVACSLAPVPFVELTVTPPPASDEGPVLLGGLGNTVAVAALAAVASPSRSLVLTTMRSVRPMSLLATL
jgi:hypothetical protein